MKIFNIPSAVFILLCFLFSFLLSACAGSGYYSVYNDIPILSQDELTRPYTKLGRIRITREVFGADYSLSPDIMAWGFSAVREEAGKMGADAIILPEVSGGTTLYGVMPSTEYRATGFAIKFK